MSSSISKYVVRRCEADLKAWGRHFEHILYLRKTESLPYRAMALNTCGKDGYRAGYVRKILTGLQSVIWWTQRTVFISSGL